MAVHRLITLAVVALICNGISGQVTGAEPKAGDLLVIRMTGDLAKEYARRTNATGVEASLSGLEIQVVARIARQLDDDTVQIEHASRLVRKGDSVSHVTLTATIARRQIVESIVPKGTAVHQSPNAGTTARTEKSTQQLHLWLSGLEGVKLRTWMLAEEIGG